MRSLRKHHTATFLERTKLQYEIIKDSNFDDIGTNTALSTLRVFTN